MVFSFFCAVSQSEISVEKSPNTISFEKPSRAFKEFDMKKFNRPKAVDKSFLSTHSIINNDNPVSRNSELEVDPYAQIDINRWGIIENLETSGEVLFSSEREGNDFNVKTYNDAIEIVEDFSII